MTTIDARRIVGTGFPPEEGKKLADELVATKDLDWRELQIDLRRCAPSLLISAFFNAFLQRIHEEHPEHFDEARSVQWLLAHPFQDENVKTWMEDFIPFTPS